MGLLFIDRCFYQHLDLCSKMFWPLAWITIRMHSDHPSRLTGSIRSFGHPLTFCPSVHSLGRTWGTWNPRLRRNNHPYVGSEIPSEDSCNPQMGCSGRHYLSIPAGLSATIFCQPCTLISLSCPPIMAKTTMPRNRP